MFNIEDAFAVAPVDGQLNNVRVCMVSSAIMQSVVVAGFWLFILGGGRVVVGVCLMVVVFFYCGSHDLHVEVAICMSGKNRTGTENRSNGKYEADRICLQLRFYILYS